MQKIIVVGASGSVGWAVLESLLKRGAEAVAAARNIDELQDFQKRGLECRHLDITDSYTWAEAMNGVDKIFLIRPSRLFNVRRDMEPFLEFLSDQNLTQAVFLSIQGADKDPQLPHSKIEQFIIRRWIPYTFLRPSLFMQNLIEIHRNEIKSDNILFIPSYSKKASYIDIRDLAEAAAVTLTEDGHLSKTYELTGAESTSYENIAKELSNALGRQIMYKNPSIPEFLWVKRNEEHPLSYVIAALAYNELAKAGKTEASVSTLERLIGRKPTTLSEFIIEHKLEWE
ncbi:MAG: NmrA family NAD(P)-binding protein [Chloroflexota bacterium]